MERDGVATFLERWLAQPMFATLGDERAGLARRVAASSAARLAHQLRVLGQGTQPSNWERLGELTIPVLLVVGERDDRYHEIASRMAQSIPDVRVEVVMGVGHACHLEEPGVVAHLLTSW